MNQGQCLCGAVKLLTNKPLDKVSACHCGMCQKWNGGPGISVDCGSDLQIEGDESITLFMSSSWAQRAFCKNCGTHLFYYLYSPSTYYVSAALFDETKTAELCMQVYIDSKPTYYSFAEKTPMLTEQDIMKMINQ